MYLLLFFFNAHALSTLQLDSVFRVLEPVVDKINERAKAPGGLSGLLGFRPAKSEWFRIYRVLAHILYVTSTAY